MCLTWKTPAKKNLSPFSVLTTDYIFFFSINILNSVIIPKHMFGRVDYIQNLAFLMFSFFTEKCYHQNKISFLNYDDYYYYYYYYYYNNYDEPNYNNNNKLMN